MNHQDFKIGKRFRCAGRVWRATDVGSRIVVAVADRDGWMNGPPYALAELVFDENDMPACSEVVDHES